jgi:hypothetical protein
VVQVRDSRQSVVMVVPLMIIVKEGGIMIGDDAEIVSLKPTVEDTVSV